MSELMGGGAVDVDGGAVMPGRGSTCRVIAVSGGKGGVGKTTMTANLAVAMARRGQRVLVLDADLGLANIDVMLGLTPAATLLQVLRGECRLSEVMVPGPAGVRVLPAATGVEEITRLGAAERFLLLEQIDELNGAFDVMLVDTAAGISANVLYFTSAAHEIVIVVTPEPTSLTDAYALMKVLAMRHGLRRFLLVVNMAAGDGEGRRTHAQLARVAERFLGVVVDYVGYVPFDDAVSQAVREQRPVVERAPCAPVAHAIRLAADGLLGRRFTMRPSGGTQFFFQSLLTQAEA